MIMMMTDILSQLTVIVCSYACQGRYVMRSVCLMLTLLIFAVLKACPMSPLRCIISVHSLFIHTRSSTVHTSKTQSIDNNSYINLLSRTFIYYSCMTVWLLKLRSTSKLLVTSICDLSEVINCQFLQFAVAVAPSGPVHFLLLDQQNSLPDHMRNPAVDSEQFRWDLKTYLFAGHSKR